MLRDSLLVQPISGFVPFSEGGTIDAEFDAAPRISFPLPARQPAAPVAPAADGMRQAVWAPHRGRSVRAVEMTVLGAVCSYFVLGLCKLIAGWL